MGGGLGVSFFLVCVVHGFPKVLMQPTSPFVQSVQMKENDSAQFRLLHMETLNSERQGCLCLAKARGVKGPPSHGKKIPSAFKCRLYLLVTPGPGTFKSLGRKDSRKTWERRT